MPLIKAMPGLSEADKKAIFEDNARKLFKPSETAAIAGKNRSGVEFPFFRRCDQTPAGYPVRKKPSVMPRWYSSATAGTTPSGSPASDLL